jgi:hypothetical protein
MFFKKDKEKKDDLKEIKEAMSNEQETEEHDPLGLEEIPEAPSSQIPYKMPERENGAPLFVKVEKYRSLISNVHEMKNFIEGLKQLFNVMYDIETMRGDTLKILKATTVKLEKTLTEIDYELLRPKGYEEEVAAEGEVMHLEESLSDLQRQLQELKRELQNLR